MAKRQNEYCFTAVSPPWDQTILGLISGDYYTE